MGLRQELLRVLEAAEEDVRAERERQLGFIESLEDDRIVPVMVEELDPGREALEGNEEVGDEDEETAAREIVRHALEHLLERGFPRGLAPRS
jgi:hypothetical protein